MRCIDPLWPASYQGCGIWIEPLPDGTFVGLVQGGYRTRPYADRQEALADITAWIDAHTPLPVEVQG